MLLPKRIWKDIPGFEGLYQVSNDGKVRSLNYNRTGKKQILKQSMDRGGYKMVQLWKNNKKETCKVHRLVAQTFIPNPNNWPQVNHKDENKSNNHISNLEWCTQEYNSNYGTRNERISVAMKGKPKTEQHRKKISENHADFKGKNHPNYGKGKAVLMFTLDGQFIRRFDCIVDANEFLGKNRNSTGITNCIRGDAKTAYGYKWKYEEDCK